jgi:hypothetical protein
MKIVTIISRVLAGLVFVVFGANLIHPFLPMPKEQMPELAGKFFEAMFKSHYMQVVGLFQFAGGLLLLIGRFVPLGLTLLFPVIVNILLFHTLLAQGGLFPLPLLVTALWLVVFVEYRSAFAGVFKP